MDAESEQFWKHARHLTLNNWKLNRNPRSSFCDSQHQSTGGGSRTPNRRIWNPVLCQLSYTRSIRDDHVVLFLARLFMERVLPKFRTILHQLQPLRPASLLDHSVVPLSGLRAFKPHILTHDKKPSYQEPGNIQEPTRLKKQSCLPTTAGRQPKFVNSEDYFKIFVTTPEPTVLPPSRIAKRLCSSIAIGLPSSTSTLTLSPGMHISAPPSNFVEPVTSVVRK